MRTVDRGVVRVTVCPTADLPLGEVQVVEAEGHRIAVFHTDDGLFAVEDRCTHQGAALSDGFLEGCRVECPLHASSFDLRTGAPSGPPARKPVATYPVAIEAGTVYVEVAVTNHVG
jgi:3-phenylpropionate/trans-cinnamate dioxygenase ferredoxin component